MIRFLSATVALIWIFPFYLAAQFYLTGENPPSVKWNELKTEHFRIIYPGQLANDAARLGSVLEFAMDSVSDMDNPFRKRTPVLMQNGTVLSNGFVTLAPFRMELDVTPPQDIYAQDWISQLGLHEFRHVAQLNQLNQRPVRVLRWLTGDIAQGILSSRFPSWFYEGDAVYNETRLSLSGRGRVAGFEMPLRTLLMEQEDRYSYDKMMFGSFKDFVPDPYIYGYKMTGYLRQKGGPNVWSKAVDHLANRPYRVLPLATYLKKNFGFYKQGLYYNTIDSLKQQYKKNIDSFSYTKTLRIGPARKTSYTSYLYPLYWDQVLIAFRSSLDHPGSFVMIDSTGKEKIVLRAGRLSSGKADISGSVLIWDEVVTDPRWNKRSYSVIRSYNLETKKHRTLSRKSRYFSPDFSADGKRIAVVETDMANRNSITIIEAKNGLLISKFHRDEILSTPEWTNENEIAVITTSDKGKQLELLNIVSGQWRVLIPYTYNNIADQFNFKNYILFRADWNDVENLFAIDKNSQKIYQVTNSVYGVRLPSVSAEGEQLVFSEYSAGGFDISSMDIIPGSWKGISPFGPASGPAADSAKSRTILSDRKYREWAHVFRIHSWIPLYTDLDQLMNNPVNVKIYPGLMLFSQNTLGTMVSSLSYSYQDGYNYIHPVLEWRGWYPVFRFNADIGGPQTVLRSASGHEGIRNQIPVQLNLQTYIPLSFSVRANTIQLIPGAGFEYIPVWYVDETNLRNGVSLVHLKFSGFNYRRMSVRDLYPRLGQNFNATMSFEPGKYIYGYLYSARTGIFLPGPFLHHHIIVNAGFQIQKPSRYLLPYLRVNPPRGYQNIVTESYAAVSVNYAFPLAYPDISIAPILYIKRFRMNLFYDFIYSPDFKIPRTRKTRFYSTGGEFMTDLHAVRLIFPISAGIRLGYKSFEKKAFTEFVISMDTNF